MKRFFSAVIILMVAAAASAGDFWDEFPQRTASYEIGPGLDSPTKFYGQEGGASATYTDPGGFTPVNFN